MKLIAPSADDPLWRDNPGSWGCEATDIWSMLCAALEGDVDRVRTLAGGEPNLTRAEYWYTQPLHFAVREGHAEVVRDAAGIGRGPERTAVTPTSRWPPWHATVDTRASPRSSKDAQAALRARRRDRMKCTGPLRPGDRRIKLRALDAPEPLAVGTRRDDEGFTPLHRAVEAGQAAVRQLFSLRLGAARQTPFRLAAEAKPARRLVPAGRVSGRSTWH